MNKHLIYQMYIMEPASRRFKALVDNKMIESVFDYLSGEEQVSSMIEHTLLKRPAMEAVIEDIEIKFPNCQNFDLEFNYRHRQILGSMIRHIMGHNGYWPGKAKSLKKGRFVKTAIVYSK
jgi:hypothetical protein